MASAALTSLSQTLKQIPEPVEPPFASLQEMVSRLLLILEDFSRNNSLTIDDHLEGQIRDASYQVEYIIESYISTQALSKSVNWPVDQNMDIDFGGLQKRIDQFDSLLKTLSEIDFLAPAASVRVLGSSRSRRSTMVGRDEDLDEIMGRLIGHRSRLDIISIVGMGGLGKTTLAGNIFNHPLIQQRFDIRASVVISQEYNWPKVCEDLLNSMAHDGSQLHRMSIEDLSEQLYKTLKGRRYLIMMDDVWDIRIWDDARRFLVDDCNGSRIILTTRFSELAVYSNSHIHEMRLLDVDKSWHLLCQKAFGEECCPPELEYVGRMVALYCKGLPLAIVLVGGVLSKGKMTQDYWEYTAENLRSAGIRDHNNLFMGILSLSYKLLPHHLKPCFLYMGVFPEGHQIFVSQLIKIWIAEGFIKPLTGKSLEEVAEDYLNDLIERDLVMVLKRNHNGGIKVCIIHDLLMELCMKIAHDEKFFQIINPDIQVSPEGKNNQLRLSIRSYTSAHLVDVHESSIHTLLYFFGRFSDSWFLPSAMSCFLSITMSCTMLRVLDAFTIRFHEFPIEIVELVYLRYLALLYEGTSNFPESISKLRDLQTLIVYRGDTVTLIGKLTPLYLPSSIWEMPQLRHLLLENSFLPLEMVGKGSVILENLQTLSGIINFRCSREVLEKMPNLKKLGISYFYDADMKWSSYEFNNFVYLHQLETLKCHFIAKSVKGLAANLTFPPNLKRLSLSGCRIPWEKMTVIGSLPNLEALKLKDHAFEGQIWEPNEGEFSRLMFLLIEHSDLEQWRADNTHFPNLKHLNLNYCLMLTEIPSALGEIPTLEMLELSDCSHSAVESARQIQEEQWDLGNDSLTVRIRPSRYY